MIDAASLRIATLGPSHVDSPLLHLLSTETYCRSDFMRDCDRVLFDPETVPLHASLKRNEELPALELAGPRRRIYFRPEDVRAAIVTCGGLCPGINGVIRALVMELHYWYGVTSILGIRHGYQGFIPDYGHDVMELTPTVVRDIHNVGGTILSSSRGQQDTGRIIDFLVDRHVNVLLVIGGDGTLRAALDIAEEARERRVEISVVGIPKTIDNDILYLDQSFGFETAFSEAVKAITSAHTEALGSPNGIGLVKLMGRHSGFIACHAALAMNDVNFVLIPEVPFVLDGDDGFLSVLRRRMRERGHAVIVAAEGAGQELMDDENLGTDASGNVRLRDIGLFLRERINKFFHEEGTEVNLKYIDPSYIIRSVPASPQDSLYCMRLGQHAVHAAMSGRTKMVVGRRHGYYVNLPMELVASGRRRVDPYGDLWLSVLEATGQPITFEGKRS